MDRDKPRRGMGRGKHRPGKNARMQMKAAKEGKFSDFKKSYGGGKRFSKFGNRGDRNQRRPENKFRRFAGEKLEQKEFSGSNKFMAFKQKATQQTKEKLRTELLRRDNLIVQTVKAIDLLDKEVNLMTEHIKEWYALYFPELARIVVDPEEYVKLVANLGYKDKYTQNAIIDVIGSKGYASKIVKDAETSMGAKIKEEDIGEIINFANKITTLNSERNRLTDYLKQIMLEEAPNMSAIIGPTIGARLISTAGSLERFSRMPSSTIQVLGAEKALFSHLRKGTASPKYGIIFQYPKLRGAKKSVRGKIARKLASKISIASKLDFFKGEFKGDKMSSSLQSEIDKMLAKKD